MAYLKRVSRAAVCLIVMILDDSGSMGDPLAGTSDAKFVWVERYFGKILEELLARCTEPRGSAVVIKPRYCLYVIRYGSTAELWGEGLMDIEAAALRFAESHNSLGLGGNLGGTDAQKAFEAALNLLQSAIQDPRFRDSFPPMVMHLTDGESATDASRIVSKIANLATSDGNVLVLNAYIGSQTSLAYKGPEDFPGYVDEAEAGPAEDNLRLFKMSSPTPQTIWQNLVGDGIFPKLRENSRLFFDVRTKETLRHVMQVVGSLGSRADRDGK